MCAGVLGGGVGHFEELQVLKSLALVVWRG